MSREHKARVTKPGVFASRHLVEYVTLPEFVDEDETPQFARTCNFTGRDRRILELDEVEVVEELPEGTCLRCRGSMTASFLSGQGALDRDPEECIYCDTNLFDQQRERGVPVPYRFDGEGRRVERRFTCPSCGRPNVRRVLID